MLRAFARALTKQRTEETRKTTGLSQSRTEAVKQASDPGDGKGTVQPYQTTDPKDLNAAANELSLERS